MPRQELANTFSDGLMMDLNPINTPKSVLTDCLNGTYITYNGNEFVLQNDMGNYKLKNCKLPTNFIPVGVKGYADILYIVSYNPFTKEVEIGSYPAPQSIFTTSNEENKVPSTDEELAPFNWPTEENTSDTRQYPELIKNDKKPLFIFAGSDEETYKLNPGDEFKLEGLNDIISLEYIYQHLNFYVIDEDNKLYDLDDSDMYFYNGEKWSGDTMRKVFWETPGWLAAQYDLYVPDKFNLNLKSLNVPEFLIINDDNTSEQAEGEINPKTQFEASMDLSSQVIITDLLFQNELNKTENIEGNHYKHLYIRYKIETTSGKFHGFTTDSDITVVDNGDGSYDIPCKWHNYQDDVITAFVNCSPVWWMDNPKDKDNPQNYDGVIAVTAYPIIKYNGKILEFTQFETKLRFPLNTLKNSNNITIADSIYKWSVDDDSCTISFNINGPFINASNITGRYEIYRINLFKNPPKQDWDPTKAKSSLDNPESYSKWTGLSKTINAKIEGVLEKLEGKDEEEFIERAINANIDDTNPNDFINQKKILMCKGTLPNLVLYGQNTININWDSSNEYKLTGYQNWYTNPDHTEEDGNKNWFVEDTSYVGYENQTKTIDFSKEGGIYIFRVILEQGNQKLAESKQVLIPSEVFNEWFGSIDNYNDIYENQWVEKYKEYITCSSISILNIITKFNNSPDFITYNDKSINKNTDFLTLFKTFTDTEFSHISKKPISQKDTLKINYSKEIKIDTIDVISNFNSLKGNLWNVQLDNILSLLQNSANVLELKTQDFKTFNINSLQDSKYTINYIGNTHLIQEYSLNQLYPNKYQYIGINTWGQGSNAGRRGKIWGQFWRSEYGQPGTTINIGGGTGEIKDWTYDTTQSLFQDPNELWNQSKCRFGGFSPIQCWNHESNTYCRLAWGDSEGGIDDSRVVYDGRGNSLQYPDRCLVFPAANQYKNDSKDGAVVVVFGSTSDRSKAISILQDLYVREYRNSSSTVYSSKISTQLELNSDINITINKINLKANINLLRVDDKIISFKESILNINDNFNLCTTTNSLWENNKQIYNISSTYTLMIDLLQNPIYSNLYSSFNAKVDTYNNETDSQVKSATEVSTETSDNVIYNGSYGELDPMVNTIKKKIVGLHKNTLTVNNACWDNQTWTTVVGYKKDNGGDIVNTTGRIVFTYIEDFQNI